MTVVSFLWSRGHLLDELLLQQKTEKVSRILDTCGLPCVSLEASLFVPTSEIWEAFEDRNVFNLGFVCYRLLWPCTHFQSCLPVCCRAHWRGSYQTKRHRDWPHCRISVSWSVMGRYNDILERVKWVEECRAGPLPRSAFVQMRHRLLLLCRCQCPPLVLPSLNLGIPYLSLGSAEVGLPVQKEVTLFTFDAPWLMSFSLWLHVLI